MALTSIDIQRFLQQWVVVQLPTGSIEGCLVEVTSTAFRLHPVMAVVAGNVMIDDYSVVAPLEQVTAMRGCSREVAEGVVQKMRQAMEEARAATEPPPKPPAQWGNPL